MSGQIKAIQCSVYGMLHHCHGYHILHCIIWHNALALCVNAVHFFKRYPLGLMPHHPTQYSVGPFYRLLPLQLLVGRKPKNLLWNSAKLMNTINSFKTHVFYYDLYDQSDEFNVIGQQVSYCRRPRATCHITGRTSSFQSLQSVFSILANFTH